MGLTITELMKMSRGTHRGITKQEFIDLFGYCNTRQLSYRDKRVRGLLRVVARRKWNMLDLLYAGQCLCRKMKDKKQLPQRCRGLPNDEICIFRLNNAECAPCCGKTCQNSPFAKSGILPFDLELVAERDEFGLITLQEIKPGDFIMEATGEVRFEADVEVWDEKFMTLVDTNPKTEPRLVLDMTSEGTAVRFCKQSHQPNCQLIALTTAYGKSIRFVLSALRPIHPYEQLTWRRSKWSKQKACNCGDLEKCIHFQETPGLVYDIEDVANEACTRLGQRTPKMKPAPKFDFRAPTKPAPKRRLGDKSDSGPSPPVSYPDANLDDDPCGDDVETAEGNHEEDLPQSSSSQKKPMPQKDGGKKSSDGGKGPKAGGSQQKELTKKVDGKPARSSIKPRRPAPSSIPLRETRLRSRPASTQQENQDKQPGSKANPATKKQPKTSTTSATVEAIRRITGRSTTRSNRTLPSGDPKQKPPSKKNARDAPSPAGVPVEARATKIPTRKLRPTTRTQRPNEAGLISAGPSGDDQASSAVQRPNHGEAVPGPSRGRSTRRAGFTRPGPSATTEPTSQEPQPSTSQTAPAKTKKGPGRPSLPPRVCPHCNKTFTHKGDYEDHVQTHSKEKPYKCSHCPESFKTEKYRKKHERHSHSTGPLYRCVCGQPFNYQHNMRAHALREGCDLPYVLGEDAPQRNPQPTLRLRLRQPAEQQNEEPGPSGRQRAVSTPARGSRRRSAPTPRRRSSRYADRDDEESTDEDA